MSTTILKPHRDADFYVVWESIVEAPTYWGTRKGLLKEMSLRSGPDPERFDRADKRGSSALWTKSYDFDDPDRWMIYKQRGLLKVEDMDVFCYLLQDNEFDDEQACELLTPLED